MRICVITLGEEGSPVARAIAERCPDTRELRRGRDGELAEIFARAFAQERGLVCVMAAGIAARMIAPLAAGKLEDPAVVVVDDAARYAISLLSGHEGGANALAYRVAAATGAQAVISTGSETRRVLTLGIGCRRGAAAAELRQRLIEFLDERGLKPALIRVAATIDAKKNEDGLIEALEDLDIPLRFFSARDVRGAVAAGRDEGYVFSESAASRHAELGLPSVAEPCALLASRGGRIVVRKKAYGCASFALAEEEPFGAVLATEQGPGLADKAAKASRESDAATGLDASAAAQGQAAPRQGSLAIVGIGPGGIEHLTPAARRALLRADYVAGYGPYLELIRPLVRSAECFSSPMTEERERARKAIDAALAGRRSALIASGDACVYGIGGMALELADETELASIALDIIPGITAANAAASLVGSPFENDYAVISLSDLITPRERIQTRLRAIAAAGFPLALYNPRSAKRRELYSFAIATLLDSRPGSTPSAILRDALRPGQEKILCSLGELAALEDRVTMNSIVLVASADAYVKGGFIVEPRFKAKARSW